MDINEIEETIHELENASNTFENAFKLSALYIVRENMKPPLKSKIDGVETELHDILPQYQSYVKVRRDFQLGKTTEDAVLKMLEELCQEIREFLQALYISTSNSQERRLLIEACKKLDWSP